MQFNSYSYLALLVPVVAVYWQLPLAGRRWYLLLISIAFYASWTPLYTVLPFMLCGISYACARRIMASPARASFWLKTGIGAILIVLVFFKYREFILLNLNRVLLEMGRSPVESLFRLALPLGISFYSFEAISYLIDTRQGRVKDVRPMDLMLFVTFWPHLIAGPIVRVRELVPQFHKETAFDLNVLHEGVSRILWGLVQKNVLANSLAPWVEEGFLPQAAGVNSTIDNWALALAFGFQIYFDFAAYSNMAIGAARLVGITLPENFRFPYHAANPSDFWSRWHMTLSRWIRDYLFFRINVKYKGAPSALYLSLIGTMALVGLWHGAGWGFMLWGVFHGVYLVLYRIWESFTARRFPAWPSRFWARWAWRAFTLGAVMMAWIPFRAGSFEQSFVMVRSMLAGFSFYFSYNVNFYLLTLAVAAFAWAEPYLAEAWAKAETRLAESARGVWLLAGLRPAVYAAALLLFLIFDELDTQFIYFQF